MNYKERQDILNRLMSKNFTEYQYYTSAPEEDQLSEADDPNLVDIMEAREDILSPGV